MNTLQTRGGLLPNIISGIVGGLVGGVAFGLMMAMMGMLSMIAGLVGSNSSLVGFLVHGDQCHYRCRLWSTLCRTSGRYRPRCNLGTRLRSGLVGLSLISTEQRLSEFAFKSLPQRIAGLLLEMAQPAKPRLFRSASPHREVVITHGALSEMLATYRETVTKILNEFRVQGLIELRRGRIVLLDEAGLQKINE